jgi:hypothetical protein
MSRICQGADAAVSRRPRASNVIYLDDVRLSLLAEEIAAQIRSGQGSVIVDALKVGDVERWRRAARKAGRVLGVPVRTGVAHDGSRVWAVDNS